jgi:hypothetical protein
MSLSKSIKNIKIVKSKEIDECNKDILCLTEDHKKILNERRAKHLSGESKSYTLKEVKSHARASRNS